MSGISHFKTGPFGSGGVEVSKGTNLQPVTVTINAGETSADIPVWLSMTEAGFYFDTIVVDPVDVDGPDESVWVRLSAADVDGDPEGYGLPGASLSIGVVGPGSGVADQVKHFVKVTVPSGTTAQIKVDVKLHVTGVKHAVAP